VFEQCLLTVKDEAKVIPILVQAWTGQYGCRRLRLPEGGKGCQSLTAAAITHTKIYLVLISIRGWVDPQGQDSAAGRNKSVKYPNDAIGNRTRAMPQPTAPPRASENIQIFTLILGLHSVHFDMI
jgi:hypothetical protein